MYAPSMTPIILRTLMIKVTPNADDNSLSSSWRDQDDDAYGVHTEDASPYTEDIVVVTATSQADPSATRTVRRIHFVRLLLDKNVSRVEPLPFHGMSYYPYPENESYPYDNEHSAYLEEYNTREWGLGPDNQEHNTIYTDYVKSCRHHQMNSRSTRL